MSALGSSEASAPQRLKCISIMGSSNGATQLSALGAVSSLGRVRFRRFHCMLKIMFANIAQLSHAYQLEYLEVVQVDKCKRWTCLGVMEMKHNSQTATGREVDHVVAGMWK